MQQHDLLIIGGGPAGSAAAITAARAGVRVVLFEKGPYGRDKVCGDGLTPRAIAALNDLGIDHSVAHRIDGLRMIAGKKQRELAWPTTSRFPNHGAVWPRQRFDNHLLDVAIASGADVRFESEALPVLEDGRVVALDGKVTLDDNADFRQPDHEALVDHATANALEAAAKEKGLNYVKLDNGQVGIIGNGAG
ncbi:MAG: FAD-dependent oxidoreductase, partial [Actinobacteria bacterium]|nr:FAD-dependent oxidoreductase [Actinomycetota bacterium]